MKSNLINLFSILNGEYNYYQGFHDISVYFMLIFNKNENLIFLEFIQRLSEFYFKDYITEQPLKNLEFKVILQIFVHLVELKDKSLLDKVKKEIKDFYPYFTLSWIISWFTQSIKNLPKMYRVLDYLICSHPLAVYHMSAEVFIIF